VAGSLRAKLECQENCDRSLFVAKIAIAACSSRKLRSQPVRRENCDRSLFVANPCRIIAYFEGELSRLTIRVPPRCRSHSESQR
jgi:hypothetical protein